ncbi:MAG: hypothetical protein JW830_05095, partial [Bacteroidales bacterium]|nr:hypothetical protein [Bacteroidales bacterium]
MKKIAVSLFSLFLVVTIINGQDHKTVTVKAGTRINDYFTQDEQYRYPEFTQGKVVFKDGTATVTKLNYSILAGEMQFLASGDTMAIANEKNIKFVQIMLDTFYFDNGYLEAIAGQDPVIMTVKQYVKLADIKKEGPMGTRSSTSSAQTWGTVIDQGHLKNARLVVQEDLVLSTNADYFIGNIANGFVPYRKGNVLNLYPQQKKAIDEFL